MTQIIEILTRPAVILPASILIPLLGCVLTVWTGSLWWLFLLVPLFIHMEAGLVMAGLAVIYAWTESGGS